MIKAEHSALGTEIRLHLEQFTDGWGWRAWEESAGDAWRALPTPAPQNQRRRFRTQQDAEQFFDWLAEFVLETARE